MEILKAIKSLFQKKQEKKYHWYEAEFKYSKNGRWIFSYVTQLGLADQSTVINKRALKKIVEPVHLRKGVKSSLCNGVFDVTVICYLGHFSK